MNEELNKALEQISDDHLNEAVAYQRKGFPWVRSIAAVLAVVIAWTAIWAAFDFKPPVIVPEATDPILQGPTFGPSVAPFDPTEPNAPTTPSSPIKPSDPAEPNIPTSPSNPIKPSTPRPEYPTNLGNIQPPGTLHLSNLVAGPKYPQMVQHPVYSPNLDYNEYYAALTQWRNSKRKQHSQPEGYADSLTDFWAKSIPEFLSGDGNRACSPANVYLALAMLAEVTGGQTRQQVLDLLGADSIATLRTQAGHVWNALYCDDGETTSLLANSLWLDDAYNFKDATVQNLVNHYYASVFNGDLGTEEMNRQLRAWLNSQTGGLLQEQTENSKLDPASVFALASTIYFAAGWDSKFNETRTADGIFHGKDQDLTVPFMNKTITDDFYYWGEDYGAIRLSLTSGSMWLILPDEGKTVEDVLASGEYLEMIQSPAYWKNKSAPKINLSMPKFDISFQANLVEGMKNLGLTHVFDSKTADFTPITNTQQLFLGKVDHAVRVSIDEEGILAAAYTVMDFPTEGIPIPPESEINFDLDRPFLFMVTDDVPLVAGVVEQP